MTDLTEKTLATERKYTGKIISVDMLDIELPDGRKAKREVIRHGNAVAILARRPDGKFVFVKQYRKAAEEALIEVIAGGLEPGEDPIKGDQGREARNRRGDRLRGDEHQVPDDDHLHPRVLRGADSPLFRRAFRDGPFAGPGS